MGSGNWFNNDGLYIEYGTARPALRDAGTFTGSGPNRITEFVVNLAPLTTTPAIVVDSFFFPIGTNIQIERVEVVTEVAAAGGTSFSVGLMKQDRTTVLSNTAFIDAMVAADNSVIGEMRILTDGSTAAGNLIGAGTGAYLGDYGTNPTEMAYITALAAGTYTAGRVRIRIYWHGVGVITQ